MRRADPMAIEAARDRKRQRLSDMLDHVHAILGIDAEVRDGTLSSDSIEAALILRAGIEKKIERIDSDRDLRGFGRARENENELDSAMDDD